MKACSNGFMVDAYRLSNNLLLIKAIISSASNLEKLSDEVDDEAIVGN